MASDLSIHTIDVGQGESSLIVANSGGVVRSMLIDGGLGCYAEVVHSYVESTVGVPDHILISHYDKDHSGGLLNLLISDNLYNICDTLAYPVQNAIYQVRTATTKNIRRYQLAAAAAVSYAIWYGGYGSQQKQAENAFTEVRKLTLQPMTDLDAVNIGMDVAYQNFTPVNSRLGPTNNLASRFLAVAATCVDQFDAGEIPSAVTYIARRTFFDGLASASQFMTGGNYREINVIDIGDTSHASRGYAEYISGGVQIDTYWYYGPTINRKRLSSPALGQEILWNSGFNKSVAAENAPAVFVMARNKYIWKAPSSACPISSGQPENDDSIALIIRFNDFFYYTGADLPTVGEELIAKSVMKKQIPNPAKQGSFFELPRAITAFKCGHHGSSNSSSVSFLNQIKPRVAMISCGSNQFGKGDKHPDQILIDRLQDCKTLRFFYLTNCLYQTNHVPSTFNKDQLKPLIKSRVCGDNWDDNLAPDRKRGDIVLEVSEQGSQMRPCEFDVSFFNAFKSKWGSRVEKIDD